jgi:hypothetical protein
MYKLSFELLAIDFPIVTLVCNVWLQGLVDDIHKTSSHRALPGREVPGDVAECKPDERLLSFRWLPSIYDQNMSSNKVLVRLTHGSPARKIVAAGISMKRTTT